MVRFEQSCTFGFSRCCLWLRLAALYHTCVAPLPTLPPIAPSCAAVRALPDRDSQPERLHSAHLGRLLCCGQQISTAVWVAIGAPVLQGCNALMDNSVARTVVQHASAHTSLCFLGLPAAVQFGTAPVCQGECNTGDRIMYRAVATLNVPVDQGNRMPEAQEARKRACRYARGDSGCENSF